MSKNDDKPVLPPLADAIVSRIFTKEAKLIVAVAFVSASLTLGGFVWAQSQLDKKVQPLAEALKDHEADAAKKRENVKEELSKQVADLRKRQDTKEQADAERFDTLYQTILTRKPSSKAARLRKPVIDTDEAGDDEEQP